MEFVTIYLAGVVALIIAFAIRASNVDLRSAVVLGLFWPLSLVAILVVWSLDRIGWDFDASIDAYGRWFAMRRPVDGWKGLAVTFFRLEIRVWKKRNKGVQ